MPRQYNSNPEDIERRPKRYKTMSYGDGASDVSAERPRPQPTSARFGNQKRYVTVSAETGTGANKRSSSKYIDKEFDKNYISRGSSGNYNASGQNRKKSFPARQSNTKYSKNGGLYSKSDTTTFPAESPSESMAFGKRWTRTPYKRKSFIGNRSFQNTNSRDRSLNSKKPFGIRHTYKGTSYTQKSPYKRSRQIDENVNLATMRSWGSVARNGTKQLSLPQEKSSYRKPSADSTRDQVSRVQNLVSDAKKWGGKNAAYKLVSSTEKKASLLRSTKDAKTKSTSYAGSKKSHLGQFNAARKSVDHIRYESKKSFGAGDNISLKDVIAPRKLARAESVLGQAVRAYGQDRFGEVVTMLNSLGKEALMVGEVAELLGLALYRQGKWSMALKVLTAFTEATGSFDQYPVLMDINRALGRHRQLEILYEELRHAGVSSDLMAEARIVMVSDLADRGQLQEAIKMIAPSASRPIGRPQIRHIRQWFVLADLYERAGEIALARSFYAKVLNADPNMADVAERLAMLS